MTNETKSNGSIEVTAEERQAIFQRLLKRNYIRRQIGLRQFDTTELYQRKVQELSDQKYHEAIRPFLVAAYERYPGSPGLPSRLKQHADVIMHAEELAGIPEHLRRPVSFVDFLLLYISGGLPMVALSQS